MRSNCQAKLGFTDYGEFYPSTESRILTTQTESEEAMNEVIKQIISKVTEVAKSSTTTEAI